MIMCLIQSPLMIRTFLSIPLQPRKDGIGRVSPSISLPLFALKLLALNLLLWGRMISLHGSSPRMLVLA